MAKSELQIEIDKREPFDSLEQEAYLNIARSQGLLGQEFERLFQQHGVSAPQYNVLRILRGRGEGVSCLAIARNMVHRMPDITRLGDRLEQAGLVTRGRTQEDRRVVLLKITAAGLDLLARLDAPVRQLHKRLLGHLDAAELTELNRLLAKARRPWIDQSGAEPSSGDCFDSPCDGSSDSSVGGASNSSCDRGDSEATAPEVGASLAAPVNGSSH